MFQIMTNQKDQVAVFWFRRDLRLEDNVGLSKALKSGHPVVPIFIFDDEILNELDSNDPRVSFIHERLKEIHQKLEYLDVKKFENLKKKIFSLKKKNKIILVGNGGSASISKRSS